MSVQRKSTKVKKGTWIVKLKKLVNCGKCDVYLENSNEFEKHKQGHEKPNIVQTNSEMKNMSGPFGKSKLSRKHSCSECSKTFVDKYELKKHVKVFHEGFRYDCDKCDKIFKSSGSLFNHKQSSHEGIKYICEKCNKCFSDKSSLKRHHDSMHAGIRHKCDKCEKEFNHKENLWKHKKQIHDGIKYKCKVCDRAWDRLID